MVRRIACSVALIVVGVFGSSAPVMAFYDSLTVIPASPRAGQGFSFSIRSGGRDGIIAVNTLDRTIVRQGNTVRVTVRALVQPDGFPTLPTDVYVFDMESLEAGTYRLEVARRNVASVNDVALVATTDFVVAGAVGEPISALSWWGKALLLLGIAGAGLLAINAGRVRA